MERVPSSSASADPGSERRARPTAAIPSRTTQPLRLAASTGVLGLLLTCLAAFAAARVEQSTEERLLEVQTRQAASVLAAAVTAIEAPLRTALEVDRASRRGPAASRSVRDPLAQHVGADALFVTMSLWRGEPGGAEARLRRVATFGARPGLDPTSPTTAAFLDRAWDADTTVVRRIDVGARTRIGYAVADPRAGTVVYAERAIPEDRRAPVDRDSAYSGLHYAIYLGPETRTAAMTTTNVDPGALPLDGDTVFETSVPFGDEVLTLVTSPREQLGSPLGHRLPWLLLLGGVLISVAAAIIAGKLAQARHRAEADTATIQSLYDRVDSLYGDQRELFVGLQRALLPHADPHIPHIEVAADYVAGAIGIDIGGDWYSVIGLDQDRYAFVVGDVSGRGVEAVAEMARARFTIRAYLIEGHTPARALAMCSRQFDVLVDGHIVTALVGVGDHRTGEVVMANAGHPMPLVASPGEADFVPVPAGPPLGLGTTTYDEATTTIPAGSTLLCYTDGLVERRGEHIDEGLARLRHTAGRAGDMPLGDLVEHLLDVLGDAEAPDDTAILALRRFPAARP